MIPYAKARVKLLGADGRLVGELTDKPVLAKTIVLVRKGFGLRVELAQPKRVKAGGNATVLVELVAPGGRKPVVI